MCKRSLDLYFEILNKSKYFGGDRESEWSDSLFLCIDKRTNKESLVYYVTNKLKVILNKYLSLYWGIVFFL